MHDLLIGLRLVPSAWLPGANRAPSLWGPALTATGAWFIVAFNRFGPAGLVAPRATVRFVLIGFYAWLALALLLWVGARLLDGRRRRTEAPAPAEEAAPGTGRGDAERPPPAGFGLVRAVEVTGRIHRPLLLLAFALQILSVFGTIPGLGTILVGATAIWMAGMTIAALAGHLGRSVVLAAATAGPPLLLWWASAGRYLVDQQQHLF